MNKFGEVSFFRKFGFEEVLFLFVILRFLFLFEAILKKFFSEIFEAILRKFFFEIFEAILRKFFSESLV